MKVEDDDQDDDVFVTVDAGDDVMPCPAADSDSPNNKRRTQSLSALPLKDEPKSPRKVRCATPMSTARSQCRFDLVGPLGEQLVGAPSLIVIWRKVFHIWMKII